MQLKLGDKIWMYYGPSNLVVGYLVEHTPNEKFIGVSPAPYDEYNKLPLKEKASVPVNWFDIKYCTYIDHISYEDLQKIDQSLKPTAGFRLTA